MGFELSLKPIVPKCILVDKKNKFQKNLINNNDDLEIWSNKCVQELL